MGNNSSGSQEQANTPQHDGTRSRILSLDPRSPTTEISRTPIVVTKTPEGGLQDPLDPRSPTVGIDRTPLYTLPAQRNSQAYTPEMENSHNSSPATWNGDPTDHSTDCGDLEEDCKLMDPLTCTEMEDLSTDDFPDNESTRLMPEEKLTDLKETVVQKKKKPKIPQPKELFPLKKTDNTRSPLSTIKVDTNSPAHIVQRKQIKSVEEFFSTSSKSNSTPKKANSKFIVWDQENQ